MELVHARVGHSLAQNGRLDGTMGAVTGRSINNQSPVNGGIAPLYFVT